MRRFVRFTGLAALSLCLAASAATGAPQDPSSETPTGIVARMEAGQPFLVAARKGAIPLREEGWSYPAGFDNWVVFEGRYTAESGIWQSDAIGFTPRGNEYHGCPPDLDRSRFICGGAHSDGYRLSRALTPRDHVVVILGNELPFDEDGNVYRDGVVIGVITFPPAP